MHQEKFNNLQPQRLFQWANAILTAPIELDWPLLMQWILGVDDNFFFFSKFILDTYLLKMAYKGLYIKEIQVSGCTFRNFVNLLVATTTPNEYQSNYGSPVSRLSNYFPCCSITFFCRMYFPPFVLLQKPQYTSNCLHGITGDCQNDISITNLEKQS